MIWTITKKNIMRFIASFVREEDKALVGTSMLTLDYAIRKPWKEKHLARLHRIVRTLVKKKWLYLDEPADTSKPAKYIPTPEGIAWLKTISV